jgi:DNA-binding beta-propeller fold protein YncE
VAAEGNQKMVIWIVAISLVAIILVVAAIMFGQQDGPPTYSTSFGSGQASNNEGDFNAPVGVTVAPNGTLFVLENKSSRIQQLTPEGKVLAQWGSVGAKDRQFDEPLRLAADSGGNLWVADTGNHRVQWFSAAGEWQGSFGSRGGEPGEFSHPAGLAFDSNNNLYVADCLNNRIQKIGRQLNVLQIYPESPDDVKAMELLNEPWAVAIDATDTVYVADTGNNRIVRYSNDGRFLSAFGSKGKENGRFDGPKALAFDADGNLVVVDTGNNRLQKFTPQGEFMYAWGSPGMAPGMFNNPQQLAIASDGTMYVADAGNNRVQKFLPRRRSSTNSTLPIVGPTRPVFQADPRTGNPDTLPPSQGLPGDSSGGNGAVPPAAATALPVTGAEAEGSPTPLDPALLEPSATPGEL